MAESDTRRWLLRDPGAEISNNNIPTAMLVQWANRGIIKPGYAISADGETWLPVEALPELAMIWYIIAPGRAPYGPVTRQAAEQFIREGHFPSDALISQDPGEEPVSMELPLAVEEAVDDHVQQALEEATHRIALLEKELRLKDKRIDELRIAVEAPQQDELDVEGMPNVVTLTEELAALQSAYNRQRTVTQEAAEAAAERERELRQRIHTLEAALEVAQSAQSEATLPPDEALFAVLSREAEVLRQSQDEEERFIAQIRELAHMRLVQLSERLLEIRRLAGDDPAQMVTNAMRRATIPMTAYAHTTPAHRHSSEMRINELEKALAEAREREVALQRQLVAQEGRETQLRADIGRAERRSLESLDLDEKLRETAQSLERERAAREEEHRENAHIQEQLLRRIEELERLTAGVSSSVMNDTPDGLDDTRGRSSFGWLRKH